MEIILFLKTLSALGMVLSLIAFLYTAFDWKKIIQTTYNPNDIVSIYKIIPLDKHSKFIILKAKNKLILVFISKDYAKLIYEMDYEAEDVN
ncbi:MAG: hypothetical protein ACP5S8_05335 [Hydrogenobaculum sp.]